MKWKDYWDQRATKLGELAVTPPTWTSDEQKRHTSSQWALIEPFLSFARSDLVIDLGCGVGRMSKLLGKHVAHVVGLDASPQMVAMARKHGVDARLISESGQIPLSGGAANGLFTCTVLQHVPDDEIASLIAEVRRVVRPSSRILLLENAGRRQGPRTSTSGHVVFRGAAEYERLFQTKLNIVAEQTVNGERHLLLAGEITPAPRTAPRAPRGTTLQPRPSPWKAKTSVLVPCAAKHAALLPDLLKQFASQTTLPDEVVICISGMRDALLLPKQPYSVRLLTDASPAYAGKNRNRAASASSGDILIYQDADDIPHPQRIEIVKHLFSNFFVEHLLHGYTRSRSTTPAWLAQRYTNIAANARYEPYSYTHTFTNGNAITSREVFQHVRWPEDVARGQDVIYNKMVHARFPNRMVRLNLPLLTYRQHLSTARG